MAGEKTYYATVRVVHNGVLYEPGAALPVDDDLGAALVERDEATTSRREAAKSGDY